MVDLRFVARIELARTLTGDVTAPCRAGGTLWQHVAVRVRRKTAQIVLRDFLRKCKRETAKVFKKDEVLAAQHTCTSLSFRQGRAVLAP